MPDDVKVIDMRKEKKLRLKIILPSGRVAEIYEIGNGLFEWHIHENNDKK